MPSETDLRDLLRGAEPEGRDAIDVDAVLRRARRRRRPRVIAAQALGGVAVVGALATGVLTFLPASQPASIVAAEDADGGGEVAEAPGIYDSTMRKEYDACGAAPSESTPSELGLESLTRAGDETAVTLTLRNDGDAPVVGTAALVALSFTADGIVVDRGLPTDPGVAVDLDPGESMSWSTTVGLESCAADGSDVVLADGAQARAIVEVWDGSTQVVAVYGVPGVVEIG